MSFRLVSRAFPSASAACRMRRLCSEAKILGTSAVTPRRLRLPNGHYNPITCVYRRITIEGRTSVPLYNNLTNSYLANVLSPPPAFRPEAE